MGDACRMKNHISKFFINEVGFVRRSMEDMQGADNPADEAKHFWQCYRDSVGFKIGGVDIYGIFSSQAEISRARIGALMQILGPQSSQLRRGLVEHLASAKHDQEQAVKALTELAVFSFEGQVREAALAALKKKNKQPSEVLLKGLRYPWPAIAQNAADAIAKLDRKDLVPELVNFLDEADPRAPITKEDKGAKRSVVREVVRLNHHQSCLLCHPPVNLSEVKVNSRGHVEGFVTGAVPIPGEPLPSFSNYSMPQTPDIVVRADVTYLRQDFSLMQKVDKADPWPEMQRFDFLVRTREVTAKEVVAYDDWRKKQGPDYLSPNHQAALSALRQLTGRDAEPTAAAWRKALALSGAP
jgi:hypothetical protein